MDNYQIAMLALSGVTLIATLLVTRRGPKPGKRSETKLPPGVIEFPKDGPVPQHEVEIDLGPQIVGVRGNPWKYTKICGNSRCTHSQTASGLCPNCGEMNSYIKGMAVAHRGREPTWEEIKGYVQRRRRRG